MLLDASSTGDTDDSAAPRKSVTFQLGRELAEERARRVQAETAAQQVRCGQRTRVSIVNCYLSIE